MMNETISPEILEKVQAINTPSLITLFFSFAIFMILFAFIYKKKGTDMSRFFGAYFTALILSGIVLVLLIFFPEMVLSITNWIKSLI